jgi:hypothetical protein
MWSRLLYVLVTAFFILMNVLLWRSEYGGRNELGSAVPAEAIWRKMLIAPDNSRLEIRHHGRKIGYGTWAPTVGEGTASGKHMPEDDSPEGMIREPSGYSIDFSGNLSLENFARLRYSFDLRLATNHHWQEVSLHLGLRPNAWEVRALAADQTIRFTSDDEAGHNEQVFRIADLQDPERFFQQTGWPISPALLTALGLPTRPAGVTPSALGLKWEARSDWLKIATERMRVYRVQARLLERYSVVFFISLEGEILRVELPDEIVLVNDQLTILP